MKYCAIDEGRPGLTCGFDAILQHSPSHAAEGVGHHGGGNQLVGMKNDEILCIVNDTLPFGREVANDMDVGVVVCRRVEPRAAEMNRTRIL